MKQKEEGDRTIETKWDRTIETKRRRRQNNWNKKETEQLKQKEQGDRTNYWNKNFQRNHVNFLELKDFGKKSESAEKQQNSSHWDISSISCVTVDVKKSTNHSVGIKFFL